MTRYYGLYARHHDNGKKLRKAIHQSKHKFILSYSKWRNNIAASFGYDPLCCSKCKSTMTLTHVGFRPFGHALFSNWRWWLGWWWTGRRFLYRPLSVIALFLCPLLCGHFYYRFLRKEEFPIIQKSSNDFIVITA